MKCRRLYNIQKKKILIM